jgi:hypothetical protein
MVITMMIFVVEWHAMMLLLLVIVPIHTTHMIIQLIKHSSHHAVVIVYTSSTVLRCTDARNCSLIISYTTINEVSEVSQGLGQMSFIPIVDDNVRV